MIYYEAEITLPKKEGSGTIIYKVDRRNLISLDISVADRSDFNAPSFGIVSNVGNIEFIDNKKDASILEYAKLGLLKENLPVSCFLVNSITNKREKQAAMITSSWAYDAESKRVSLSIKDFLEEWQDIGVESLKLDVSRQHNGSFLTIYDDILKQTPEKYKGSNGKFVLYGNTVTHISSLKDNIGLFDAGNLWNVWDKFCRASQTHIFVNEEGNVVVNYNGGN